MNVHDSEKIAGLFSESGYHQADGPNDADVIVLNTCSIREKAEQKFYSELGRLKKIKLLNPDLKVAVAGCIAQQQGAAIFKRFPYVDYIFGPDNIDSLQKWLNGNPQTPNVRNHLKRLDYNPEYHMKNLPAKREGGIRAWISIMYGCDNFCAYCVVPYTRGRERSRSVSDIFDEVKSLSGQGVREITLLGQNVNSYGKKLPENRDFADLLEKLHDISGIERIRFVTSHPRDLSGKLIKALQNLPKVCEHLHLPVQSGSDKVLQLMNRGYTYQDYKGKIDALRDSINNIAITTDIIVGFPGESGEDHHHTLSALSEIGYDGIFAFKYSRRPGTKALELPDHVDEKVKSARLAEVLELQDLITYKNNKRLEGEVVEVLVEGESETDPDRLTGRTSTNKIVNFSGDKSDVGNLVNVGITEARQHSLIGRRK